MDRPHALERLLLSIARHAPDASVHVADQSERFEAKRYDRLAERLEEAGLRKRPAVQRLPFDCGVSAARNRLVESTPGELKLMLDDDLVFTEGTDVGAMAALLEAHPEAGAVGGAVVSGGRLQHSGTQLRTDGETVYQLASEGPFLTHGGLRFQRVDCVPMFVLMRRELFEHVRWDPLVKTAGEDLDFFLYMRETPFELLYTPDVTMEHPGIETDMSYMRRRLRGEYLERILSKHGVTRLRAISGAIAELNGNGQLIWYCETRAAPAIPPGVGVANSNPERLLAEDIRRRLGPQPTLTEPPLVSIVVLNRNGAAHLRRLLAGLVGHTDYPRLELIVVDNGSEDDSLRLLREVETPFPLSVVANPHNESFSDANNQGAELASGELLLLLNNDVEPFEAGWLHELVAARQRLGAGAVAATLVEPEREGEEDSLGPRVQSGPIWLRGDRDSLTVDGNFGRRRLFDARFGEDFESAVAIAACLLVDREAFDRVGGLTHGYFYGGEDEDLCLKLRERGATIFYSGRSVLFHRFNATSRSLHESHGGRLHRANSELSARRWGPRVLREYELDRLSGRHLWSPPDEPPPRDLTLDRVLALSFCLIAEAPGEAESEALQALEEELARRGHRSLLLRDEAIDDFRGHFYDVVVQLRGSRRCIPRPSRLNVLWVFEGAAVDGVERRGFDLVIEGGRPAGKLIEAAIERAARIGLPTRIAPC